MSGNVLHVTLLYDEDINVVSVHVNLLFFKNHKRDILIFFEGSDVHLKFLLSMLKAYFQLMVNL